MAYEVRVLRCRDDRIRESVAVERIGELTGVVALDAQEVDTTDQLMRAELAGQAELL